MIEDKNLLIKKIIDKSMYLSANLIHYINKDISFYEINKVIKELSELLEEFEITRINQHENTV